MKVPDHLIIRRNDTRLVVSTKVLFIFNWMVDHGLKIQGIKWLFKLAPEWMTLNIAYNSILKSNESKN